MNGALVLATGRRAPRGALFAFAVRLADHARELGLRLHSIRRSRQAGSLSCYIALHDQGTRLWIVRVSDHRWPASARFPQPHLDIVTPDGDRGFRPACRSLALMANGTMPWHDAETEVRMPRARKVRR